MFCLRSWLPLLFIPTNASPLFLISFVTLTYLLHRPCIYCSALLVILFASTCHWSDRCFLDLRVDWFAPRYNPYDAAGSLSSPTQHNTSTLLGLENESLAGYIFETVNNTAKALAGVVVDETQRRLAMGDASCPSSGVSASTADELTGFGLEWMRSLVGRREWTLPCVDVKVRV
ncbi:bladder cancer-related protein BC10-domain-containing protein [Aspergillus varians]